ncbi:MAG: phosphoribosyltransferase [Chitinophagales bacterium]
MIKDKPWDEIAVKIRSFVFEEHFDMIVTIANGGIIPAALINQRLQLPIELLKLSYRDSKQQPMYESPRLLKEIEFEITGKKILLVEDRVKTGATLQYAKELLQSAALVKTFAVNGKADYALYDEACFNFPWIV